MDLSDNISSYIHSNSYPQRAAEPETVTRSAAPMNPRPGSGDRQADISVATGTWSLVEDNRLKDAVAKHGNRWSLVAGHVKTRNGEQCAKRWNDYVNPDLDHSPWSAQEDKTLISLVDLYGHNWKLMSENFLPTRSALAIKNRHSLLMRRQKREARQSAKQQQHQLGNLTEDSAGDAPARCPFDLVAIESLNTSTTSSASSPFTAQDQVHDQASSSSLSSRATSTDASSASGASYPAHRNGPLSGDPTVESSRQFLFAPDSRVQYGHGVGQDISLPQMRNSMNTQAEWYDLGAYDGLQLQDFLGGPDSSSHQSIIDSSTPSSLGRDESVRSGADQDMEFSVTCSRSKLKSLVCHAFEGAMLEMDGSAEGEPVTVTLRLKK